MTNPAAMTAAMNVSRIFSPARAGMSVPAVAVRVLSADSSAVAQTKALPQDIAAPLPPAFVPAIGKKRFRVGVLTGCVMRVLFGDVNRDTVRVLAANGCEVLTNRRQGCCGALHLHNGYLDDAKGLMRRLIDAFWPFDGLDAIVVNSAGCGSTMREYGALLADDPEYAARAAAFAGKVRDVSEFLDEAGWVAPLREVEAVTVAYHDACHLALGQRVREAPRRLLGLIPNLRLVPLAESEICCGSAGIYNLTEPEMARRLQTRKVDHVIATGASVVATGNPGCLAWIEAGLAERGLTPPRVVHPITLLSEALDI
jgi:glycolate oxidase iron-sulfur subunit